MLVDHDEDSRIILAIQSRQSPARERNPGLRLILPLRKAGHLLSFLDKGFVDER